MPVPFSADISHLNTFTELPFSADKPYINKTYRFFGTATARTGNSGDGYAHITAADCFETFHHFQSSLLAHRTILFQRFSEMFVYTDTLPPGIALWIPNLLFALVAAVLYNFARR